MTYACMPTYTSFALSSYIFSQIYESKKNSEHEKTLGEKYNSFKKDVILALTILKLYLYHMCTK